ncbi:MAG: yecA family protein [Halioglobus sp.]|jgi:yecA family protein
MYDDDTDGPQIFDFEELANHLLEQGLQSSPSDIHGCLCGLLAAGAAVEPELALSALIETLDLELRGELAGQVMQLYTISAAALEDEEFDFHPLLPDDESDIETRALALAGWCQGFLSGFALVSAGASSASENAVSRDSAEVLKDFAAIAQAETDTEDREDEEASEENYFELVEYLRFATLNVYLDSRSDIDPDGVEAPAGKRPLH